MEMDTRSSLGSDFGWVSVWELVSGLGKSRGTRLMHLSTCPAS